MEIGDDPKVRLGRKTKLAAFGLRTRSLATDYSLLMPDRKESGQLSKGSRPILLEKDLASQPKPEASCEDQVLRLAGSIFREF